MSRAHVTDQCNKWKDRAKEFKALWTDSKTECEHWYTEYRKKCREFNSLQSTHELVVAACEKCEAQLAEVLDMIAS